MPGMSENTRRIVRDIAFEVADVVVKRFEKTEELKLDNHAAKCDALKRLDALENQRAGAGRVLAIIGCILGALAGIVETVRAFLSK